MWSAIFLLWAVSSVLAWNGAADAAARPRLGGLFAAHAGLNVFSSFLFFTRHRPDLSAIEAVPFVASMILLVVTSAPIDNRAAWLNTAYLVWVTFATVLNARIVWLNSASRSSFT